MQAPIARVVDPFLAQLDAALGPRYSAVLYGSAARGDWIPGRSDINLLLVIDEVGPATLRALEPAFAAWRKSQPEPPLLMTRPEWRQADDAFPIEITDIGLAYETLRGDDPVQGLEVGRDDLRRALEHEFRGKLLRLRQGYVAAGGDAGALGMLAAASTRTVRLLFRCLLVLLDRPVPREPAATAEAAAAATGLDAAPVLRLIPLAGTAKPRCTAAEFEAYLDLVERAARHVDQLQIGGDR